MSVGRIFSKGGHQENFSKLFLGGRSGEICFFPLETTQEFFLLKFSKSSGALALPASLPAPMALHLIALILFAGWPIPGSLFSICDL